MLVDILFFVVFVVFLSLVYSGLAGGILYLYDMMKDEKQKEDKQ